MLKEVDSAGQYTLWRCTDCAHVSKRGCDMSKHIEAKHIKTGGFNCSYCGKLCPSTNALRAHISRKHRESHSGSFDPMLKHFWNGHLFFVLWLNPVLNIVFDCKSFFAFRRCFGLVSSVSLRLRIWCQWWEGVEVSGLWLCSEVKERCAETCWSKTFKCSTS